MNAWSSAWRWRCKRGKRVARARCKRAIAHNVRRAVSSAIRRFRDGDDDADLFVKPVYDDWDVI
jgi:hypothetical protein